MGNMFRFHDLAKASIIRLVSLFGSCRLSKLLLVADG
jgi:hypothetical protein